MYGLIGQSTNNMPGCIRYVIATDPGGADALWVTEVWESEADHKASLTLPAVKKAIARGRPLIISFDEYHATEPIGGYGIKIGR